MIVLARATVPELVTAPDSFPETAPEPVIGPVRAIVPESVTVPVRATVPESVIVPARATVPESVIVPARATVPESATAPVRAIVPESAIVRFNDRPLVIVPAKETARATSNGGAAATATM